MEFVGKVMTCTLIVEGSRGRIIKETTVNRTRGFQDALITIKDVHTTAG